jgi:hypothetical protein
MGESTDFVKDRGVKTISAAQQIAGSWTWQEKTIPQMQAALVAIIGDNSATPPVIGQEEVASVAEQVMLAARGAWDAQLDVLHRRTVQGVGMVKNKYRNDPAKLVVVGNLSARGTSRKETLEEALAWESAWSQVDPAWAPLPANTLAAFKTLRNLCEEGLQDAYSDAQSAWRKEVGRLAELVAVMNDINQAWYADATKVFPAGTPEGDMIRGTIPTTYSPPPPTPPPPPAPPNP